MNLICIYLSKELNMCVCILLSGMHLKKYSVQFFVFNLNNDGDDALS